MLRSGSLAGQMSVVRPDELGELIRTRRQAQRMTQAQLGVAVGAQLGRRVTRVMVGHWERGRRMPTDLRTIGAIAAALGLVVAVGGKSSAAGAAVGAVAGVIFLEVNRESEAANKAARAEGDTAGPKSGRPEP